MALVNMKDMLSHAYRNRYAVGAFEIVNLDFLRAVIDAAEASRAPVILNLVEAHFPWFDIELLMAAAVKAAKRASVPVAIHMDHCSSLESISTGINFGANSVMFDGPHDDLAHNIKNTRKAVQLAHACGVPVEGEMGHVAGINDDHCDNDEKTVHTSVIEAKHYVERTGVDFLAISIGTVHGHPGNRPKLDFARLSRIRENVPVPLVIHGGTGLSDQQYHKLIDLGVAKINYFTALAELALKQVKSNLSSDTAGYLEMSTHIIESISGEVQRCMQIGRSAGRAAEVMIQCAAWQNVEHVIVYNPSTDDAAVIEEMLRKGKEQLSKIPGVLEVEIGKSINDQGKYRYCWLIRFAHEEVFESYKTHASHVSYADQYFRPLASDRITNDYTIIEDLKFRQQMLERQH